MGKFIWVIKMLYERLKQTRTRIGITQVDIAKKLGITKSGYCRFENEMDTIPLKHLIKVCNILDISLDYVFSFNDLKQYKNINKEIDLKIIGQRLKDFRKENGLTQVELAKFLNTDHQAWSIYEKGKSLIGTPFLYSICKKYNVSADYLLGRINTNALKKD